MRSRISKPRWGRRFRCVRSGRSTRNNSMEPPMTNDPLFEGEEPPPPGVKLMAVVRWVLLGLAAFLAVAAWWSYASAQLQGTPASAPVPKYHCPMHPQIVSDEPGECPICHMTLEPITANRGAPPPATSAPPAAW